MTKTTLTLLYASMLAIPSLALGQAAPAPAAAAPAPAAAAPAPAAAAPAPAAAAPAPAAATPAPAAAAPAPAPAPVAAPAPAPVVEAAPPMEEVEVAEVVEEEVEEESGGASMTVFADAWGGYQTSKSNSGQCCAASGADYALNGPTGTQQSGFGLNWLGTDFGYDGGTWAVTSSIRMGDAVPLYNVGSLGNRSGFGVTAAYATLRPADGLSLDMGAFPTIYGAEVAESWNNMNYTRSELYYNMQPFWHTGLRMEYATGDFVVRGLVVEDPNTSNLGNGAINFGLQAGYDNGTVGLVVGALQSGSPKATLRNFNTGTDPDAHTNTNFVIDTFIDAVLTVNAGDFSLVGNFDFNAGYTDGTPQFWGGSLIAGYRFAPAFGIAVRGDYLSSKDGFLYGTSDAMGNPNTEDLVTGTLTFDWKPIEDVDNVVLRWDNRIQAANQNVYASTDGKTTQKVWFGSVVGAVIYADLL